jgi:nucleoid-associated protein Lsr2
MASVPELSERNTMKVTIDSTEPLADALRVIGALYNVTLAEVDQTAAPSTQASSEASSRRSGAATNGSSRGAATKKSTRRTGAPKSTRSSGTSTAASSADIRKWALDHGYAVSSRGTLPAEVKAAYAAAH